MHALEWFRHAELSRRRSDRTVHDTVGLSELLCQQSALCRRRLRHVRNAVLDTHRHQQPG